MIEGKGYPMNVFDILGPVMIGPSSSHTAGAARIGLVTRALLGKPAAEVTLSWNVAATSINAVLSTIASVVIYMALRPALQKSGLFSQVKAAAK